MKRCFRYSALAGMLTLLFLQLPGMAAIAADKAVWKPVTGNIADR